MIPASSAETLRVSHPASPPSGMPHPDTYHLSATGLSESTLHALYISTFSTVYLATHKCTQLAGILLARLFIHDLTSPPSKAVGTLNPSVLELNFAGHLSLELSSRRHTTDDPDDLALIKASRCCIACQPFCLRPVALKCNGC